MIKISDIPDTRLTFHYLKEVYGIPANALDQFGPRNNSLTLDHNLDLVALKKSIDESLTLYGNHGWMSEEGPSKMYTGFSLTYNPSHQDSVDPNMSTMGSPKQSRHKYFWANFDTHPVLKNSYFDTYGFRKMTPSAEHGALGEFLRTCKRSFVRSRMSIINGSALTAEHVDKLNVAPISDSDAGWHKDEPIFENLRINIPIIGGEEFAFEMEDRHPYYLEPGKIYSWDTHQPHRVYCRKKTEAQRFNLVIGVSPWFDYDATTDSWTPNEFCMKKHPFDMIRDGDIFPWIK
jgi:hypothetical protein